MSVPADGSAFSLQHVASGLFLGINDAAEYAGAEAILVAASNATSPQWFLREEQNASYLINAAAPTVCLNVAYESKTTGGKLQQWDCNGGASEIWSLVPASNGNALLVNKNSGLAAGAMKLSAGSSITQVEAGEHPSANWKIIPKDRPLSSTDLSDLDLTDEMIYNVYAPIYSATGTLCALTSDLRRIASLGFSTILLMPIHPIGIPIGKHPAVQSPYAVADFYAVDPALGQLSDFADLVKQAHILGLKIIMDVVLNHTSWNHPFVSQRLDLYVHTKSKKKSPDTIAQAFWFEDVAQLDYKSGTAVQEYMSTMLVWWVKNLNVDGFRFDTADNPYGKDRMIPASAWHAIGKALRIANPDAILLGECTNPDLSLKPFNVDYTNYSLQPAIVSAIKLQDTRDLPHVFEKLKREHPAGMLHTSIMQTWDMDLDLNMYGGPDGTLVAAVFNFTNEFVPMLFAGEEVGNDRGGVNTHLAVNWNGPLAARFTTFYRSLGLLRRHHIALRRGSTVWLKILGVEKGVVAFMRSYGSNRCLVVINFSTTTVEGNVIGVSSGDWIEVTPPGVLRPAVHSAPPLIKLGPLDFAIFTQDTHVVS